MPHVDIKVRVNGVKREAEVDSRTLLVDLLRDDFMLTGTHIGCLTGNCGACTVIMNGLSVKSCTVLAAQANDADVLTIEGLSPQDGGNSGAEGVDKGRKPKLHPIQEAFIKHHALQCGYCTPGMILSAYQLLRRNPNPTEQELGSASRGTCADVRGVRTSSKQSTLLQHRQNNSRSVELATGNFRENDQSYVRLSQKDSLGVQLFSQEAYLLRRGWGSLFYLR